MFTRYKDFLAENEFEYAKVRFKEQKSPSKDVSKDIEFFNKLK